MTRRPSVAPTVAPTVAFAAALAAAVVLTLPHAPTARACTSVLVTPGASAGAGTIITYAADSHTLYGALSFLPAADHPAGAVRVIHDWDEGDRIGEIPEVPHTYAVVGHQNEHQVVITETTFGGRPELEDPTGGIDYGSLMFVTLQRAKTAREAIDVIAGLVDTHGYRSGGESFSIGDPKEAWIFEIVGKGPGSGGAVWAARRIPDGAVSAHANQARIGRLCSDRDQCRAAPDVITFAREKGYFTGKDADFHFADAYAPLTFEGLRFCEARVWRIFSRVAPSKAIPIDYARGDGSAERLPLWIEPDRKLTVADVMALMRDHFEGTELDLSTGIGAGAFGLPYRWRPLTWAVDDAKYVNERAVSTQQTGFSLVAQARTGLPDVIGGVQWFGVDDTFSTVYVPMYCGLREVPRPFAEGTASFTRFSWDSAFWVFNFVSHFTYLRYRDMIRDVQQVQRELEGRFLAAQADVERAALARHQQAPELARADLTAYSARLSDEVLRRWRALGEALLLKYLDGNVRDEHDAVGHPGYPEPFRRAVVAEAGERLKLRPLPGEPGLTETVVPGGWFHDRDELGERAAEVPADFPFDREKLFLLSGDDACGRPPRCCLRPTPDAGGEHLTLEVPDAPPHRCGAPSWLVAVPRGERRPVVRATGGH